jgi:D-alanyl-D-alanine carboxypeptidase (penicillin-binding protein 5/6)
MVLVVYAAWTLARPLPSIAPTIDNARLIAKVPDSDLQWPSQGQAAVGIVGTSILETHGKQQPVPIASTAKLITALTVLQTKPLLPGEQGPTITLGPADVALYNSYHAQDGSLVRVQNGEKISEYQALQTIMLPSSNNMADSLAIWAFGSLKNYQQAANQFLEDHGLVETHVGKDASGLDPSTTSTASDLAKIGELSMQSPVLAQIVGQSSASGIPVVGTIKNVNQLLGTNNIIGVKTGNTDQAGGVYVSASRINVNNKPVTIVTALAGAPGLWEAMHDSLPLIKSAQNNFKPVTVAASGSDIANYEIPWGGSASTSVAKELGLKAWGGSTLKGQANLRNINTGSQSNQLVGRVTVSKSVYNDALSAPVKLQTAPGQPSAWWRLTHPF